MAISDGVLGMMGVKPEQYAQARALYDAGISSFQNADRLGYVTPEMRRRLEAASAKGLTYLNGDSLVPGGTGVQNQNAPTFYMPKNGVAGGIQNDSRNYNVPSTSTTPAVTTKPALPTGIGAIGSGTPSTPAIVDALRQKPQRFEGFGMGLGANATTPQINSTIPVNAPGFKKPNGLFSMR